MLIECTSESCTFFVLKSLLRILVGFLKHIKAVKYRIVCYNDCKDY